MQFHLEDMSCGGCARAVTKAVQSVDPSATVSADPPARRVSIETSAPRDRIVAVLREAGFPPRETEPCAGPLMQNQRLLFGRGADVPAPRLNA